MCEMERGEPALVPQWYKLANGSTTSNARLNQCSNGGSSISPSNHSDENGIGLSSRNSLLSDPDRKSSSLRRSFSSNASISGKSQAYSSFRRGSRERNQEKSLHLRNRENRSVLIDDELLDHDDFSIGSKIEKDALRRSQSMITERRGDTWTKRIGSAVNNGGVSGVSILSGAGKTTFERDFPSLGAEGRQGTSAAGGVLSFAPKTAVQSLPVGPPVIIGTSALAEVSVKVEPNGPGFSSTLHAAPLGQVSTTLSTTSGLNMAEALAQAPSQVRSAPQSSIDNQRIEELTLRKCKQLIPVTPSMPKTLICNSEKAKPKGARGVELNAVNKVGQQSALQIVNHAVPSSARSDVAKPNQAGNLQVLNREKNGISTSTKDAPNVGKVLNPVGIVQSASVPPLKSPIEQKIKVDYKGTAISLTQSSFGERKPLSQARGRNDFFNLLRKKSSGNSNTVPEPGSIVCSSTLEKSDAQNLRSNSPDNHAKDSLSSIFALKCSMENGNCVNGDFCVTDEHELPDHGEINPYSDPVEDPEEEAFLQSLGWDKNVREEALTKEEIDGFLKKYEKQRPSKLMFPW